MTIQDTATQVETVAKTDLSTVEAELGFVKANWGKLSTIVVASAIVGAVIGHIL